MIQLNTYNAKATCPACGHADVSARFVAKGTQTFGNLWEKLLDARTSFAPVDFLQRECQRCAKTWAEAPIGTTAKADDALPRHLRIALANATKAFETRDTSTLGTINEDIQPVVDAAVAWINDLSANLRDARNDLRQEQRRWEAVSHTKTPPGRLQMMADALARRVSDPQRWWWV